MRDLSLESKITIFKSLALSKIVCLGLHTIVPKSIIEKLNEMQKKFLCSNKKSKIKHGTLCNDYRNEGLRNVDINLKFVSLKCSWIRRLCNECHNDWKITPLNYINNALGKNFNFNSNLSIRSKTVSSLPSYYKDIINSWCKYYSCTPKVSSLVSSQFLWYNSYIKIDNEVVCYKDFADKKINFVSMKCSWIRRLCNECHKDWKITPLNYINNALGKNFKFNSNLSIPNKTINSLPS